MIDRGARIQRYICQPRYIAGLIYGPRGPHYNGFPLYNFLTLNTYFSPTICKICLKINKIISVNNVKELCKFCRIRQTMWTLTHYQTTNFIDSSKLKEFADDNFKFDENSRNG